MKEVTQNIAAAKNVITDNVWTGNTKAHMIVDRALKAINCAKRRRLVSASVWIHFEHSCFVRQQHVQQSGKEKM